MFRLLLAASCCLFATVPVWGQNASAPPPTPDTPLAPYEEMAFFLGTWTIEEMPAEQAYVETCDWLPAGRRHMVCRASYVSSRGPREAMSLISYRPADSTYMYYGMRASGIVQVLEAHILDGGVWEFQGEEGTGDERVRTRVVLTRLNPDRFRFEQQTATGLEEWGEPETIHYVRVDSATEG